MNDVNLILDFISSLKFVLELIQLFYCFLYPVVAIINKLLYFIYKKGLRLQLKGQVVITEKYGAYGCNVGEDGGFAPDISRQVLMPFSYASQ